MVFEFIGIFIFFLASLGIIAAANAWTRLQKIDRRCRFGVDRYISVQGFRIHYVEFGEGEPLLLLHDLAGTYRTWNLLLPALSKQFKCIAIDITGLGQSEKPIPFNYSTDKLADLVVDFMNVLGFDTFHAAGFSFGGALVHKMAAQHPTKFIRGVSIEGFSAPPNGTLPIENQLLTILSFPVIGTLLQLLLRSGMLTKNFTHNIERLDLPALSQRDKTILQDEITLAASFWSRLPMVDLLESYLSDHHRPEIVAQLETPILALYGSDSPYREALHPTLHQLRTAPKVIQWMIKDGLHPLHWQHPEWLAKTMIQFIREEGVFAEEDEERLWEIEVNEPG